MGSCTRRHFLLSTCFLQMITVIERQVFDFLGYMWAPICVNFFHIIFVIFGFYGAYHFRIKYIITYLIWNFVWIAWNSFLICFYLNVGELDRDSDLLNLGTGSVSWFEVNGYGCKPTYPTNITSDDPFRPIRPERVDDCLLDYHLVEVTQSGIQCALAVFGIFGAILISTIFLDEDDRFDFMNGDAKSPQHTVVHPMYVSYTSIPTSASATLQSNKQHINYNNHNSHHQQQQQISQQHHQTQQQAINQTTYLTYTNSNYNSSSSRSYNKNKLNSSNIRNSNSNISSQLGSKHNTLTRVLYPQKNNRISASTTSIITTTSSAAAPLSVNAAKQDQLYYDDSTAKADQMFTNSNRRQQQIAAMNNTGGGSVSQQKNVLSPSSSHGNTTSSLSYASLQNSNLYLPQAAGMHSGRNSALGGGGGGMSTPLSNSNFSLNSNNNINAYNSNSNNNGRFARIHTKPRPPKSTSYSSFINHTTASGNNNSSGSSNNIHRPDIKYTQMGSDRLSRNFDENLEDDNFSLHNFKNDDDVTYVPFQKPTPSSLFINKNNNPSYTSINSFVSATAGSSTQQNSLHNESSNNNSTQSNFGILLEHGAILEPAIEPSQLPSLLQQQPIQNPANRFLYQQNGLPFAKAYSPTPYRAQPKRPTNIPLPTVPTHAFPMSMSPSDVTPPPPPAPRPHIFQPRSGNAPYPDLSPEVTEKYAMPTQYLPRSPVAIRIARRQRTQRESERTQLVNNSANFCDQIRDTPPRFTDNGNIVRARSQDRLSSSVRESKSSRDSNAAPHVNRRSGRRDGKARPRSYCNSLIGGEGVIRTNISADRNKSNGMVTNAIDEYGVNAAYLA